MQGKRERPKRKSEWSQKGYGRRIDELEERGEEQVLAIGRERDEARAGFLPVWIWKSKIARARNYYNCHRPLF